VRFLAFFKKVFKQGARQWSAHAICGTSPSYN
jgi:hypothetical protein